MNRLLVLFLLIIVIALPTITNAQEVISANDTPVTDDALLLDAMSYAQDNDVSVAEARQRLTLQKQFGSFNENLLNTEKDTFAGIWIQHNPQFRVVARFTSDFDSDWQTYLPSASLAEYVQIDLSATYSLLELKEAQSAMIEELATFDIDFEASIKARSNRVQLFVENVDEIKALLSQGSIVLTDHVSIIQVEQMSGEEMTIHGGLELVTSVSFCTTGFSVRHFDGTLGVLTAAHCPEPISFMGTGLPFEGSAYGGPYDFQWHTAPGFTIRDWIFDGTNNRFVRDIKTRDQQMEDEYVCKHGRSTGFTCGYIDSKDFMPSQPPGNTTPTYIYVREENGNLSSGGDSGGPWFSGNTAYGIHKSGSGNDAVYMAIDYISFLDLEVYIPPPTSIETVTISASNSSQDNTISVVVLGIFSLACVALILYSKMKNAHLLILGIVLLAWSIGCSSGESTFNEGEINVTAQPYRMADGAELYFPQIPPTSEGEDSLEALIVGTLAYRDKCLYVGKEGEWYLPLWPSAFVLDDKDEEWKILDQTGEVVAIVGQTVSMSGGIVSRSIIADPDVLAILPNECDEPFWLVGEEVRLEK